MHSLIYDYYKLIVNALQFNELSVLRNTFYQEYKYARMYVPYNNISKKCNLCLYQKFIIICKKELMPPQKQIYVLQNSRVT